MIFRNPAPFRQLSGDKSTRHIRCTRHRFWFPGNALGCTKSNRRLNPAARVSTRDLTRETPECFADRHEAENIPFLGHKELDLTERRRMPIIVCTSILRRSKQSGTLVKTCTGYPDGAKIYICYRRCCFLTW